MKSLANIIATLACARLASDIANAEQDTAFEAAVFADSEAAWAAYDDAADTARQAGAVLGEARWDYAEALRT